MPQVSKLDYVVGILLTPVPLLPEHSFLLRRAPEARLAEVRRKRAAARIAKSASVPSSARAPRQEHSVLQGKLEPGRMTPFAIAGQDFVIDSDTWMFGEVRVGATAQVQVQYFNGDLHARKVLIQA